MFRLYFYGSTTHESGKFVFISRFLTTPYRKDLALATAPGATARPFFSFPPLRTELALLVTRAPAVCPRSTKHTVRLGKKGKS